MNDHHPTTLHSSIHSPVVEAVQQGAAANRLAANPSARVGDPEPIRRRIPLSVPRRKLEVQEIPGFVQYWCLESDIPAFLEAGYDFVSSDEVSLNQQGQANSADESGNTDLGSRVSVLGNKANEQGKPERLVLMKIREEWWQEDRKILDDRNAAVVNAIFGPGQIPTEGGDHSQSYVKTAAFQAGGGGIQRQVGGILNRGLPKKT